MFNKVENNKILHNLIKSIEEISLEENISLIIKKSIKLIYDLLDTKPISISIINQSEKTIISHTLINNNEIKTKYILNKNNQIYKLIKNQNKKNTINYSTKNIYTPQVKKINNIINIILENEKEKLGIIQIINSQIKETDTETKNILLFIKEQITLIIIKNLELEEVKKSNKKIEKKIEQLKYLYSITIPKETKTNIIPTLKSIFKKTAKVLNASKGSLIIFEEQKKYLYFVDSIGHNKNYIKTSKINKDEGVIGYVLKRKEPLFINKISKKKFKQIGLSNILVYKSNLSFISVPIIVKKEAIGIINITEKKNKETKFNYQDLQILINISNHITKIYENNQLIKNLIKQKTISKEIKIMKILQNNLLPKTIPNIKNLNINIYENHDNNLTGDFYDFLEIDKEKLAFIICKINNQGIPGALLIAFFKNTLKSLIKQNTSPKYILENIQKQSLKDKNYDKSREFICGIIDTHNKVITYSSKTQSNLQIISYNKNTNKISLLKNLNQSEHNKEILEHMLSIKDEDKLIVWSSKQKTNINKKKIEEKIIEIIKKTPQKNKKIIDNNILYKNIRTALIFSIEK